MSYDPADSAVDTVRFLISDTKEPLQLTDVEIEFALTQNANPYAAAAICARSLAARYARRVDMRFETIESKYGQLYSAFERLARQLDIQAKRGGGLGAPVAGGISKTQVENARLDPDRVKPFFYDNLLSTDPPTNEQ